VIEDLPLELAQKHRELDVGTIVELALDGRDQRVRAVVEGAGFTIDHVGASSITATRARMLPDFVRPGLRVLFCGYNPSLYAADRGVPFARPGNRFWPAALAAGVLTVDRDPWAAVREGVGFTDMVKRASVAAAELSKDELRVGFERVTRLCEWLAPEVICFLGIGGWRDLVHRRATTGWQDQTLGSTRVYVMPNPSGLNASTQHQGYVDHLRKISMKRSGRSSAAKPTRS
jgi:TDG/mug DNA glycosylase family protein